MPRHLWIWEDNMGINVWAQKKGKMNTVWLLTRMSTVVESKILYIYGMLLWLFLHKWIVRKYPYMNGGTYIILGRLHTCMTAKEKSWFAKIISENAALGKEWCYGQIHVKNMDNNHIMPISSAILRVLPPLSLGNLSFFGGSFWWFYHKRLICAWCTYLCITDTFVHQSSICAKA